MHLNRILLRVCFVLAIFCGAEGRAETSFNDPNLHLLVNDSEFHQITNLQLVQNRVKKHGSPVLVADKPWEGNRVQAWGSVIQEQDGLLRMWYLTMLTQRGTNDTDRGGLCYAESRDGVHWTKPNLGVVKFRGNTSNNLFYTFSPDSENIAGEELARKGVGLTALDENGKEIGILNNADGITVIRNLDEKDPQKRYKLIANMQDHRMWARYYPSNYSKTTVEEIQKAREVWGQYMDTSPDGIHWTRHPRRIISPVSGDYMMVTRNERDSSWWLNERAKGKTSRNAALRTSKDLIHWSDAHIVFDTDPQSEGEERFFEWHGGMTPFNYGDVSFGFLEKWCNAGFGNGCELIVSRDGKEWRRLAPGTLFLDVGAEGDFDRTLAYPTHNAPVRVGDELCIFYTAGAANAAPDHGMPMAIGMARIRLDRFAGLANSRGADTGELVLNPIKIPAAGLDLNVEPIDRTRVRVAITDDVNGKVIPGFSYADSNVQVDPSKIYTPVRWKTKSDLSELRGRMVSLRIEIRGAILYSYRFREMK